MEKKQQQIANLETQVSDLTYEVKTLLKLSQAARESARESAYVQEASPLYGLRAESLPYSIEYSGEIAPEIAENHPVDEGISADFSDDPSLSALDSPVMTASDSAVQLRRAIDIAEKCVGAGHFNLTTRFNDLAGGNSYALELRHLCDSLRSENAAIILLYSQSENRVLFANNLTKELLGWSPEKFAQDFPSMILAGEAEWKNALVHLKSESQISLHIKSKRGQDVPMYCRIGLIPSGIFKQHAIAVLYPH